MMNNEVYSSRIAKSCRFNKKFDLVQWPFVESLVTPFAAPYKSIYDFFLLTKRFMAHFFILFYRNPWHLQLNYQIPVTAHGKILFGRCLNVSPSSSL